MINVTKILKDRIVEIYDGSVQLGSDFYQKGATQVTVYTHDASAQASVGVNPKPYRVLLEAADCTASVCVLNGRAIKILIAMYPSAPKYVLVRLTFSSAWLLGILGLLRRVLFGLVKIEGIAKIAQKTGGNTYWLVLEQSGGAVHKIPVLPSSVGIPVFLQWLKKERVNYVVLRFFESLPKLHRQAGDLDILVADEDKGKIETFLKTHAESTKDDAGDIRIGLHSVSGEPGFIPYYPPTLARQILERAINGPASSRVPAPKDALRSFIYHALYHSKKGYASGIKSKLNAHTDAHPENDYAGMIQLMANREGVEVGETMEEMDEYMANEGWRPKLDTLAKIAETNVWVRDRFFSSADSGPVGLSVFILRQWVKDAGLQDDVVKVIETEGFVVMRNRVLEGSIKQQATNHLRGGTWGKDADGGIVPWTPAIALVVADPQCAGLPAAYARGFEHFRIRALKERLRSKFDGVRSSTHSTDNTRESWEYIEVCFPNEVNDIRDELNRQTSSSRLLMWRYALKPAYIKHAFKHGLRSFIIRHFLT